MFVCASIWEIPHSIVPYMPAFQVEGSDWMDGWPAGMYELCVLLTCKFETVLLN